MPEVARTAVDMIAGMTPVVQAGDFVFVTTNDPALVASLLPQAMAMVREREGMSLLVPVAVARDAGLDATQPMRCITLNVHSSLDGVGLTAAVATALADGAIACNMIAAYHHDHVCVPSAACDRALDILTALQDRAAKGA